eukprot:scaffold262_cov164-Ochromonas_danica.AAC.8
MKLCNPLAVIAAAACFTLLPVPAAIAASMEVDIMSAEIKPIRVVEEVVRPRYARDPGVILKKLGQQSRLNPYEIRSSNVNEKDLSNAQERVLTLQAYLDEAERELFSEKWPRLLPYLRTLADQEDAFVTLAEGLFPTADPLDGAAREAMTFEGQSFYLALDDLMAAAKEKDFPFAQKSFAHLLLAYDHFLKAGDLYPIYDPIVSTEIFFADTPPDTLPFQAGPVRSRDRVVLTNGPDMGKTGVVIYIEGEYAVVKLDRDGRPYKEVKSVRYSSLARAEPDPSPSPNNSLIAVSHANSTSLEACFPFTLTTVWNTADTMSKEPSLADVLQKHTFLKLLPSNRIKCEVTQHELPLDVKVIEAHVNGKKFKKALEWYNHDFSQYQPYIVPHKEDNKKLFCVLTKQTLNKIPAEVQKHVSGKRFKRLKEEHEQKKVKGSKSKSKVPKESEDEEPDFWEEEEEEEVAKDDSEEQDQEEEGKKVKKGNERAPKRKAVSVDDNFPVVKKVVRKR